MVYFLTHIIVISEEVSQTHLDFFAFLTCSLVKSYSTDWSVEARDQTDDHLVYKATGLTTITNALPSAIYRNIFQKKKMKISMEKF